MWGWISWAIGVYRIIRGNPILQILIDVAVEIVSTLPPGAIARAFVLIREASEKPELGDTEKAVWVLEQLQEDYPSARTNMLNALIELAVRAVNRGLV